MPEELALLIHEDEGADSSRTAYGHILVEGRALGGGGGRGDRWSLDKPVGRGEFWERLWERMWLEIMTASSMTVLR